MVCVVSWSQTIKAVYFHGSCLHGLFLSVPLTMGTVPVVRPLCEFRLYQHVKEHRQPFVDSAKLRHVLIPRMDSEVCCSNFL